MSSPSPGFMFEIRPMRVSIVDRPANKRKFLITKSKDEGRMDEIIQIITETEGDNEEALVEALKAADKDAGTIDAVTSIYRTLSAFRDSITERDLNEIAKSLKYDVEDRPTEAAPAEESVTETVEAEAEAVEEETVEKAEEAVEDVEVVETVVADSDSVEEAEEVSKSSEEIDALRGRVQELETKTRRDELYKLIAGLRVGKTEDELVDVLKAVEESGSDVTPIVEVFRAADANVRASLGEIGSDMPGEVSADTWRKLEGRAREIMRDAEKPISFAHAIKRAGDENPELMKEYYK